MGQGLQGAPRTASGRWLSWGRAVHNRHQNRSAGAIHSGLLEGKGEEDKRTRVLGKKWKDGL